MLLLLLPLAVSSRLVPPCNYTCTPGGGCSVQFVGPPRVGNTMGSCFPQSFGGSCDGKPNECKDCNTVLFDCPVEDELNNSIGPGQRPKAGGGPRKVGQAKVGPCLHVCQAGGSCSVTYLGPPRPGRTSGSCFTQDFGGGCSGTPPECRDCKEEVDCRGVEVAPVVEVPGKEVCEYECEESGGCTVSYVGPPRGGPTAGSCFATAFGGNCHGTPRECKDCNVARTCAQPSTPPPPTFPPPPPPVFPGRPVQPVRPFQPSQPISLPGEPCIYLCGEGGSCKTRYAGPSRTGSTSGACFPDSFDGKKGNCFGIPDGCRDCNSVVSCSPKEEPVDLSSLPGEEKYCRISPTHTLCQFKPGVPSPRCGQVSSREVGADLKQELLDIHNNLRGRVARGEEGGQPSAADMRELVWSDELARIAQGWADQCDCVFQENQVYPCFHEPTGGKDRSPVKGRSGGQNIAWGLFGGQSRDWTNRAVSWYNEVNDFNSSRIAEFNGSVGGPVTGHYSQYVWADTRQVGCGIMVSKVKAYTFHYLACDYFPPGNVNGRPVYRQGGPCSACPTGTLCRNGLCAEL